MAFDRMPVPDEQCRHLNDDGFDNRLENLAWGTQADNWVDRFRNGRWAQANKTHCANGHPYTTENVVVVNSKDRQFRRCRICLAEAKSRYLARKAAVA
jgi:hypothetical protein